MENIKVLTNCNEKLILKKQEVLNGELGIFINCPFENGCNGTCNVTIEK